MARDSASKDEMERAVEEGFHLYMYVGKHRCVRACTHTDICIDIHRTHTHRWREGRDGDRDRER